MKKFLIISLTLIFIGPIVVRAQECSMNSITSSVYFPYAGSVETAELDRAGFCNTTIIAYPSWINNVVDNGYAFTISATANTGAARSGYLSFYYGNSQYNISLNQAAAPAPVITSHPSNQNKCENDNVTFSVTATGATGYQWWKSTNGGSSYYIETGATSSSYSFQVGSSLNNTRYRCVVSNSSGSVTSNSALLTANPATQVGYPLDVTACPGDASATFHIGAAGSNLSYQWHRSINGGGFVQLTSETGFSGINGPSLTVTEINENANAQFKCNVTGLCPGGGLSPAATLYVTSTAISMSNPSNQTICPGSEATFTINASGQSLSYQWEESPSISSEFTPITGADQSTYSFYPTLQEAGFRYRCYVTGACGASETSEPATLSFLSAPLITQQPQGSSICPSGSATFSVSATNATQYRWEQQTPGSSNWVNSTAQGANTNTITAENINNIKYRCIVSGACAPSDTSQEATLTILEPVQILTQPVDVTTCGDAGPITFSAGASGDNLTYRWERSINAGAFVMLTMGDGFEGIDQSVLTVSDVSGNDNSRFQCVIYGCGSITSNVATLRLSSTAITVSDPTNQLICPGDPVTFSVSATGENISYQWHESSNISSDFLPISGANLNTYQFTPSLEKAGYKYRCTVNGNCGSSETSEFAVLQFHNVSITVSNQPVDQTVCEQEVVQFTVGTSDLNILYQWEESINGGSSFVEIPGATNISYSFTTGVSMNGKKFRVKLRHPVCNSFVFSDTVSLMVRPNPVIQATVNSSATSVSMGEDVYLSVSPQSPGAGETWRWYVLNTMDGVTIGSEHTVKVNPLRTTTYYLNASSCTDNGQAVTVTAIERFSGDRNYIYTAIPKVAMDGSMATRTDDNVLENIMYVDGLGRETQGIEIRQSGRGRDFVQPIIYDSLGRKSVHYLPYASSQANGHYKDDPTGAYSSYAASPQYAFYQLVEDKVVNDSVPFARTIFEASPLNRVLEQGSAGDAWQPDASDVYTSLDRTIKKAYETNGADEVLLWSYNYPLGLTSFGLVEATESSTPSNVKHFSAGQLFKNRTKDEEHHEVIEFIDKQGRTILKKVQTSSSEYAQTYYIYDDLNNLVCVIPPEAVKGILATPSLYFGKSDSEKEDFLEKWAFRYRYDGRKRMIMKQVPGADPIYMVYDARDRLVLTQDGNQRLNSMWTFTKYDELNRPILTGLKDTVALDLAGMQAVVDAHYAKTGAKWGENFDGSGPIHRYTNNTYPLFTSGDKFDEHHCLTVTYYDNYDFRDEWLDVYRYVDDSLSHTADNVLYQQPHSEFLRTTGQVTGSKIKVLDGGPRGRYSWLKTVNYYDDQYKLVQSIADNYKGGQDRLTNLYDFTGKILKTKRTHTTNEISWTGLVNAMVVGNNLLKTVLSNGWSSGGVTAEQLPAGVDGWIECVISEPSQRRAFGLTAANEGENMNTIDYAFWHNETTARIYENGSLKYTFPQPVRAGDVIRIARTGTTIKYYWNGVLQDTSKIASTTALVGDASIDSSIGNILLPRASFNFKADSVTRRFEYDHSGRVTEVWHQVNNAPEVRIAFNEYNELGQLIDKKLHSFNANASDAVQSVDYRYNIRGWLKDMNDIELNAGDEGDPLDHFGFQLAYNNDIGTGSEAVFNGNISSMRWSSNLGLSDEVGKAYNYRYDNLNRITAALFKNGTKSGQSIAWSAPADSSFSESGYRYDLNGNILGFSRKGKDGVDLDVLEYEYGDGASQSNQLLSVTDTGSKNEGFTEIEGDGEEDYEYDNNGNLVWDKNKGGEGILKNGDFTNGSTDWVVSDAAGRFTFAEDSLKVTPHATSTSTIAQNGIILRYGTYVVIVDMVRVAGNIRINLGNAGFKSVSSSGKTVFTGQAGSGSNFLVSIPPTFSGRIKSIEVKGVVVISYNHLNLPEKVVKGLQQSLGYIYDATGRKISQEVYDEAGLIKKKSDYEGEFFYENDTIRFLSHEEGRAIVSDTTFEYQYHMKDHLGNVRLTFTTLPSTDEYKATGESNHYADESSYFPNYDDVTFSSVTMYNHTDEVGATRSVVLNGAPNKQVGLTKSLRVLPGDTIDLEVFAKYFNPESTEGTGTLIASAITSAFGLSSSSLGYEYSAYQAMNGMFSAGWVLGEMDWEDANAPKAFLNYILFDEDFIPYDMGWDQIDIDAGVTEENINPDHDTLLLQALVTKPGFIYIYFSNEEQGNVIEVYFDDLNIRHRHSPVIQADDYYPFGLTFNSYYRENSTPNQYQYNGKELQNELNLGWIDYGARFYDPGIGRWYVMDPLADRYHPMSPYNYVLNNPMNMLDPDGMRVKAADEESQNYIMSYLSDVLGEGHGFSFKKNGTLRFRKKDVAEGKTYSEDQQSIFDGVSEVVNDDQTTIHAKVSEDENVNISIDVKLSESNTIKYTEDQMDKTSDGEYQAGQFREIAMGFGTEPFGVLLINRKEAAKSTSDAGNGERTSASESAVFIHELLDHGLYFIRTGVGIPPSPSTKKDEVTYQNKALRIKGSKERTGTDHGVNE